jgi:hypothetical protein
VRADSLGGVVPASLATPSHVNRGDLTEPLATHGYEWLCSERMLVCHRLASSIVKVSNLVAADSHGSPIGPVNHVLRAIRGHIPPSHSRSHRHGLALPHIASALAQRVPIANLRAMGRLSCKSPRRAIRDRRLRSPTSRMAPLVKDHVPSTGRSSTPNLKVLNCRAHVPQVND